MFAGLQRTAEARRAYLEALRWRLEDTQDCSEIRFLQDNLARLDEKAASLVHFNSILLAVLAIFVAWSEAPGLAGFELLEWALKLGLLLCISSCALCLAIVYVHWEDAETLADGDSHSYGERLLWLRDRWTIVHRVAWWLAIATLADLALIIVAHLVLGAVS